MPARLIESLATTGALAEVFSDESVLQAMLDFEAALARAEARLGSGPVLSRLSGSSREGKGMIPQASYRTPRSFGGAG